MRHKNADLLIYAAENDDAKFIFMNEPSLEYGIQTVIKNPHNNWKIKPKTETRWQWAYKTSLISFHSQDWSISGYFCNEDELYIYYSDKFVILDYRKLDFTVEEFNL